VTVRRSAVEYLPPSGFKLGTVAERLPEPLHVGSETSEGGRRGFYDTFDDRLRRKGMRLVHEDGLLRLLGEDGRELAAHAIATSPETLDPASLPPGVLREKLTPLCGLRVLLRSAQIESNRRLVPVLDDEDKTVARLVAETAVLADGPRANDSLRPRLHLLGVRGYDKDLGRVQDVLERDLGLTAATETFEDELRARRDSSPAALSADAEVELTPDLPADRAAVALSTRLLHAIESNLPGTLADLDTEFLHDLRVAVRRTRSLQRELKKVFPPRELAHFREEFKWLQQVTGPSRDLDVYLLEFDDLAGAGNLGLLRALLEKHRAAERVEMEKALRSERTTKLLGDWARLLERLPALPVDDRPDAVTPIGDLAAQRIARVYRKMIKLGRPIDEASPAEALHELRKKGKELRYLLEFFAPLFPQKVTKPMVRTLKALQNTLGRHQDREVQATMVRGLAPELRNRRDGADALMAMGVLVEHLNEQQHEARAEFSARFADFARSEQRMLVKKTFG
jgi:CHAD domain-containing protein